MDVLFVIHPCLLPLVLCEVFYTVGVTGDVVCGVVFPCQILVCEAEVIYKLSVFVEPHRAHLGQVMVIGREGLMIPPTGKVPAHQVVSKLRLVPESPS